MLAIITQSSDTSDSRNIKIGKPNVFYSHLTAHSPMYCNSTYLHVCSTMYFMNGSYLVIRR